MTRILVIDDDEIFCRFICDEVRQFGYESVAAMTLREGLKKCAAQSFDIVFLDVKLPDGNGLEAIPAIRQIPPGPEVIILTGAGSAEGAEMAIRNGAWDYIAKPSSVSAILLPLVRALDYREAKKAKRQPKRLVLDGLMGRSSKMKGCFDLVAQASSIDSNTLITGETGTGKELFARAIHQNSSRSEGAFIVVDCASLTETLADSILFGHEKGAYTGADRSRAGLITQADGGTLFLDEVGELPLTLQKTFLRVLQERRFRPLGSAKVVASDFRLISATNRDLDKMVQENRFRSDLLFRLRSISIEVPPLREHPEDIGEIAIYHTARICRQSGIELKGITPELIEVLSAYPWPGNIRELVSAIEKAIASSLGEPILFRKHLPGSILIHHVRGSIGGSNGGAIGGAIGGTGARARDGLDERSFPKLGELKELTYLQVEADYLRGLMSFTRNDIPKAIELSGVGRSRLYGLLKRHKIPVR